MATTQQWQPTQAQEWLTSPAWSGSTWSREKKMNRENNYQSRMMLAAEQDFNREMAQYYDAAHVAQRYREAGINPMLAMYGSSLGQAGSQSPTQSVTPYSGGNSDWQNIFSSIDAINNSATGLSENILRSAQYENMSIDTDYKRLSLLDRLYETKQTARRAGSEADFKEIETYILDNTKQDKIDQAHTQTEIMYEENRKAGYEAVKTFLEAQFMPQRLDLEAQRYRADLSEIASRILLNSSQRGLNDAKAYEAFASAAKHYAESHRIELENGVIEGAYEVFSQGLISGWKHSANNAGADNEFQSWYNIGRLMGGSDKAGLYFQSTIAGLHEIEDVASTVATVFEKLKSIGIKETAANREIITDIVTSRANGNTHTRTVKTPRAQSKRNRK